ncbi:MAG: FtsX-like permease family protein [Anaerolineae bacterium]
MRRTLLLAWRNMWRNWRRTAIALVAIVLGVILLLLIDGLMKGSDQAIFGNAVKLYGSNIVVHAPGYRARVNRLPLLPLDNPDAVVQAVRGRPQVVAVGKRIQTGGVATSRSATHPVRIIAIEPSAEASVSLQAEYLAAGRFLADNDEDAILIGKGLADLLHVDVGDRITVLGRSKNETMRQRTMTVVGIYNLNLAEAERNIVFIPLAQAQTLYNLRGQVTEVSIFLRNIGQEKELLPVLRAALPGYEVDSWETLMPQMRQVLETKMAFSGFFGLVVVFIGCIGILNLMMMAAFERTREMGVLAALGMKARQVMALYLLEGTLIGAVAALIGAGLGILLIGLLGRVGIDISYASGMGEATALLGTHIYPMIGPDNIISRALTVTLIAALASLYPAWQASRKEPTEALRHV